MRRFGERGSGGLLTRMWRRVWARLEGIIDVSLALTADQERVVAGGEKYANERSRTLAVGIDHDLT
jgi:hypothetical protein